MGPKLRVTSAVIICVSTFLIIPKVVATANLSNLSNNFMANSNNTATISSQVVQGKYVPPNYGGPDSNYGSGTR